MGAGSSALPFGIGIIDCDLAALRSDHASVHSRRGETPGRFPRRRDRDQSAIAAQRLDLGQDAVQRFL